MRSNSHHLFTPDSSSARRSEEGGSSLEQGRFDQPSQAEALSHAAEGPVSAFTGGGAGFDGSAPVTVHRGFIGLQPGFVFDVGLSGSYSRPV